MFDNPEASSAAICGKCRKFPATDTSIFCEKCSKESLVGVTSTVEIEILRGHQAAYNLVMDGYIAIYRDLDKTRRPEIKVRMKKVYDDIKTLGTRLGISRSSMDHVWKG